MTAEVPRSSVTGGPGAGTDRTPRRRSAAGRALAASAACLAVLLPATACVRVHPAPGPGRSGAATAAVAPRSRPLPTAGSPAATPAPGAAASPPAVSRAPATPARRLPVPTVVSGSVPPVRGGTVVLDERVDRATVRVRVGARVRLILHSTAWTPPRSRDAAVLVPMGPPVVSPVLSCRPGEGCGTVRADFRARSLGRTVLTAHRSSCGEAMACAPGRRLFTVTVVVMGNA